MYMCTPSHIHIHTPLHTDTYTYIQIKSVVSFSPGDWTFVLSVFSAIELYLNPATLLSFKILLSLFWIVLYHRCDLRSNCRTVMCFKYLELLGRRGGSVENIYCSCRRLGFDSHTHTVTHNCLTLVRGDPVSPPDLQKHQACMWCTCIHATKHTHT